MIGAGWIGLEVAAAASVAGMQVTVLEHADVPLQAALGARLGAHVAGLHRRHGVELRPGVSVNGIEGDASVTGVRVDGEVLPADVVLVGVGAVPNGGLAERAGLPVSNGILVDEQLRAAEHVFAIGDVANAMNSSLGGTLRVEHWDNAIRQGQLAGRVIMGHDVRYDWQPYFYSDQFDFGMEYVGRGAPGDDAVIRGSMASGEFLAFWLRRGVVRAAMNVNIRDVNDDLRALVGRQIDARSLVDERIPVIEL